MPKALTIAGIVVAALIALLFTVDLAIGWPFQRSMIVTDVLSILCAIGLGYASWSTMREL